MGVTVKKGVLTSPGATGDQTISLPAGSAPKAIKVWCSYTAGSTVEVADAAFLRGVGTCRGGAVQQVWDSVWTGSLVATSATVRGHGTDALLRAVEADSTASAFELDLVSMSDTAVVVSWVDLPAVTVDVHYEILGGVDITDAVAGSFTLATAAATQDVSLPAGFGVPELLHVQSHIWTDTGMQQSSIRMLEGWDDGTDRWGLTWAENDAVAAPAQVGVKNASAMVGSDSTISTDDTVWTYDRVGSSGDTFRVAYADQASFGTHIGYLALRMGTGARWKVGTASTLTSGSTQDLALPSGTARGALLCGAAIPSTTGWDTTHTDLGGFWVGGMDGTDEGSAGIGVPDAWDLAATRWTDTAKALRSVRPVKPPWLVGQGTFAANTSGSLSPTVPTHQADDILLLAVHFWGPNTAAIVDIPTPSGWTLIGSQITTGTLDGKIAWFWRRAAAAGTTVTVSRGAGWDTGTDTQFGARVYVIRGCVTSGDPWDSAAASGAYTAANGSMPAVTVAGAHRTVMQVMVSDDDQAAGAAPSGWLAGTASTSATGTDGGSQTFRRFSSSNVGAVASAASAPVQGAYAFLGVAFKPASTAGMTSEADAALVGSAVRLTYSTLDTAARWFGYVVFGEAQAVTYVDAAATVAAASAVTAAGSPRRSGSAVIAPASTVTASASAARTSAVAIAASGAVQPAARALLAAAAVVAASSVIQPTGKPVLVAGAAIPAASFVTAAGAVRAAAAAVTTAASAITPMAATRAAGHVTVPASSTMQATPSRTATAAAGMSAGSDAAVAAAAIRSGAVTIAATSGIAATSAGQILDAAAAISAASAVAATARSTRTAPATVTAATTVAATGAVAATSAAAIAAVGDVQAAGTRIAAAVAAITSTSAVSPTGSAILSAVLQVAGVSTIQAAARSFVDAYALVATSAALAAATSPVRAGHTAIATSSQLAAVAGKLTAAAVQLAVTAEMTASAAAAISAAADLAATSGLTAAAARIRAAAASITAISTIAAAAVDLIATVGPRHVVVGFSGPTRATPSAPAAAATHTGGVRVAAVSSGARTRYALPVDVEAAG